MRDSVASLLRRICCESRLDQSHQLFQLDTGTGFKAVRDLIFSKNPQTSSSAALLDKTRKSVNRKLAEISMTSSSVSLSLCGRLFGTSHSCLSGKRSLYQKNTPFTGKSAFLFFELGYLVLQYCSKINMGLLAKQLVFSSSSLRRLRSSRRSTATPHFYLAHTT